MVRRQPASGELVCNKSLMNKALKDKRVQPGENQKDSAGMLSLCTIQMFDKVTVVLGLKQADSYEGSSGPAALEPSAVRMSTTGLGLDGGGRGGGAVLAVSALLDQGAASEIEKLGWEPIAWGPLGRDCTRWPGAAQPKAGHSHSAAAPPPDGLPAPSPAALSWLLLLGVYVCIQPALCIPSHFPPPLLFPFSEFFFLPPCSLVFEVLICPLTVSPPFSLLSSLPHPSLPCQPQRL